MLTCNKVCFTSKTSAVTLFAYISYIWLVKLKKIKIQVLTFKYQHLINIT